MRRLAFRPLLGLWLIVAAALPATAATRSYALEAAGSSVAFSVAFGADTITGTMPVLRSDLKIDFANVAASRVAVDLDVTGAQASFPFASQAMKGPRVLDAAEFPQISFTSTAITRDGDTARIEGNLTVRGVTRPTVLTARLYRPAGSSPQDLDQLTVILDGALARSDFGATGWSDMVGDTVHLTITAQIRATT
ncbi:MAG: hypothetical protein GC146_17450 [Limimaricola sp.]|uniref:YceI family protein n=1 Tax=Limimaricola sp. TaxID=2211665 RepID=UPI001D2D060C|nr:YceI family protein [Limimaricola sp.]MBI1418998.1 hypothetical protein [Limimaricola sp.]